MTVNQMLNNTGDINNTVKESLLLTLNGFLKVVRNVQFGIIQDVTTEITGFLNPVLL